MTSAHETAAQAALDRFLCDPAGSNALRVYREGIRDGRYGSLGDAIHQSDLGTWPLEQVACFATVWSDVCSGDVAQVQISALGSPGADADREGNARQLADLPEPFRAVVDSAQNCDDQDGFLEWDRPIQVEVSTGEPVTADDGSISPRVVIRELPPGSAPLEIGSTKASVTLMHLRSERCVARWPYGHDRIRLTVAVGEPWQHRAGL